MNIIKSIIYRLLKNKKPLKTDMEKYKLEGLVIFDQMVLGKIYYRHYKSRGKYFSRKTALFYGTLILTHKRLVAYAFSQKILDLPLKRESFNKVNISIVKKGLIKIGFKAEDFDPKSEGEVEFSFKTEFAEKIALKTKKSNLIF